MKARIAIVPLALAAVTTHSDRAVAVESPVVQSFDALAALVGDPNGPAVITLHDGTYRGDLVIKRSLTLRGESGTHLEGTGGSTVLTIEANDVAIENIHITHSGRRSTTEDAGIKAKGERIRIADVHVTDTLFGVTLQACHSCTLERVHIEGFADDAELHGDGIKLWESHDSVVRGCVVDHVRDVVVWYTQRALLEDNVVRHSRYGTHFMYAHDSIVRRSHVEGNVVGIFVMYSQRLTVEGNVLAGAHGAAGMGIGFKESDAARVTGNWFVANTTGVYLDATPRTTSIPVIFESNVLALNETALRLHGVAGGLRVHGNDFRENPETIEIDGGSDALACDVRGNHFSDYEGYDLDGDGVGDVPYRVSALSTTLTDEHPLLKFFSGTPTMQVIDAVAHAVPVFESHVLLADAAPLMRSPEVRVP